MQRREFLGLVGGSVLAGCGSSNTAAIDTPMDPNCPRTPSETAGPFPGDGSNGPDFLGRGGAIRSDIRPSLFDATGTVADGVLLTMTFTLVSAADCTPLAGRAIYVWHCDRVADYSMYTGAATQETYLRGMQETDANGRCTFTSIFPGCYTGRWPHVHFSVYASLAAATSGERNLFVSQLAFPEAPCAEVYASPGYETSIARFNGVTFTGDGVFRGESVQLAPTTGSVAAGYVSTLTVAVA